MLTCKFCSKECKSKNSHRNHERLCPSNLNRKYVSHTIGHTAWNKGVRGDPRCSRVGLTGTPHTEETKQYLSKLAKERGLGGYQEKAGRSKKFKVVDSFGKDSILQSTYELECFKILTELGINWVRPKALKYDGRNYFADFYLTDYNIYLDPKNSWKAKLDEEKINKVITQNNVKVFVLLKEQITKEYIQRLCS